MEIPTEFTNRVLKTKLKFWANILEIPSEIKKEFPEAYLDFIYEGQHPISILVFESAEDCLIYTLKYGKDYV